MKLSVTRYTADLQSGSIEFEIPSKQIVLMLAEELGLHPIAITNEYHYMLSKERMKVIDTLSYRDTLEIPLTDEELEKYELMHKVYMLVRENCDG